MLGTSLRGHLQQEWTLPLTKEISAFTSCLSFEYIKQFGFQPAMGVAETMRDINHVILNYKDYG